VPTVEEQRFRRIQREIEPFRGGRSQVLQLAGEQRRALLRLLLLHPRAVPARDLLGVTGGYLHPAQPPQQRHRPPER
jgi:hypothetical protein